MYVITFKGRPATLETLYCANLTESPQLNLGGHIDRGEREGFIAGKSAAACRRLYANWFGCYEWKERAKGVDVLAVKVVL